MTTLLCGRCGVLVARIEDHRFGLAPAGCLCVRCSHPAAAAWAPARQTAI